MLRQSLVHAALRPSLAAALLATLATGCDKVPLLAPVASTVTLTSTAQILPTGGTAEVTAFVAEKSGTPVQNGTKVRFTANLGRVDPVEADTRNGIATSTFHAGDVAGIADVRATSGAIGGAADGAAAAANVVKISVGAAAVKTVLLRANPSLVPNSGGAVELVAVVLSDSARLLAGIPVTFSSSSGQLTSGRVSTDEAGEARTVLVLGQAPTTSPTVSVTASAGAITSTAVTVSWRDPAPVASVALTATADATTALGHRWSFAATVTGTTTTSLPVRYLWDFGDGGTATTNGPGTSYVYTGDARGKVQRVTVRVELANGQTVSTTLDIIVLPPPVVP